MPDIMQLLMQNPQLGRALGMGGGANPLMGGGAPMLPGAPSPGGPIGGGGISAPAPPLGGGMQLPGVGGGSPPAPMPSPGGMQPPMGGAMEQPQAPNNQEPTGESPNQRPPGNALPNFPRNNFGAMLLPRGGQVGGGTGAAPSPSGAFDWSKILGQFLQRRQPGGMTGTTGGMMAPQGVPGSPPPGGMAI